MLVLGGGCIATAVAGLMMPCSVRSVGVVDGMLKVAVGAWLFRPNPASRNKQRCVQ
jgi:hypothetical protein